MIDPAYIQTQIKDVPEVIFKNALKEEIEKLYLYKGDFSPDPGQLTYTCREVYKYIMNRCSSLYMGEFQKVFEKGITGDFNDRWKVTTETIIKWFAKYSNESISSRAKQNESESGAQKRNEIYQKGMFGKSAFELNYGNSVATVWKFAVRDNNPSLHEMLCEIPLEEMKVHIEKWHNQGLTEKQIFVRLNEMYL